MAVTSASLIFGFIAGVGDLPRVADRAGLTGRFALAFITHGDDVRDSALDPRAFMATAAELLPLWPADDVVAERDREPAASLAKLVAALARQADAGDDLFERVLLRRGNLQLCLIRQLPNHRSGGPAPYHDPFTFDFFVARARQDEIERRVRRASERAPFALEIVRGSPRPKLGWLARARRRFRRPELRRPAR
jgi:hypothetical protein